jgi:hypothetical protein
MSPHEIATRFVLGALSPDERAELARVRLYDRGVDEAIAAQEVRLGGLTAAVPEHRPDQRLWRRISEALKRERTALAGKTSEDFRHGDWSDYIPGVQIKPLWSDRSFLLRCQPGAAEPAHDQLEDEHLIVIAGDLVMGGRRFGTGDYLFLPAGTHHSHMHTDTGCILFMQYISENNLP